MSEKIIENKNSNHIEIEGKLRKIRSLSYKLIGGLGILTVLSSCGLRANSNNGEFPTTTSQTQELAEVEKDNFDKNSVLENSIAIYGKENYFPLIDCEIPLRFSTKSLPGAKYPIYLEHSGEAPCLLIEVTESQASFLGLSEGTVASVRRSGVSSDVPLVFLVPDRLANYDYDEALQARILAHENVHLKEHLDGSYENWIVSEFNAWVFELDLLFSRPEIYGGKEELIKNCYDYLPILECELMPYYLAEDWVGFINHLHFRYTE